MSQLNLVLLGPPGSGKGTQGERLQGELGLPYYATGDILRAAVRDQTELGQAAREYMDRGDFVPDQLIIDMIVERIGSSEAEPGFILDGFPRTKRQAEALESALADLGHELTVALLIDVPDQEVVRRLTGRRVCPEDGTVYHVEFNPPKVEGRCDHCGGELEIRDDDRPDVVHHRLEQYHDKTAPLIGYYEAKGILRRVEGTATPDRVSEEIAGLVSSMAR